MLLLYAHNRLAHTSRTQQTLTDQKADVVCFLSPFYVVFQFLSGGVGDIGEKEREKGR